MKKEYALEFKNCKEGVGVFLYAYLNDRKEFQELWSVFKLLMTISHSQAIVERGFSISVDVATPNLKGETLVSLRMVHDGMNAMGIDLSKFVIPKELLAHCRELEPGMSSIKLILRKRGILLKVQERENLSWRR